MAGCLRPLVEQPGDRGVMMVVMVVMVVVVMVVSG